MRAPSDLPRRQRRPIRGRIWVLVALVVLFILLTSLRSIAGFYTDYLWFKELHFTSVFRVSWSSNCSWLSCSPCCFRHHAGQPHHR